MRRLGHKINHHSIKAKISAAAKIINLGPEAVDEDTRQRLKSNIVNWSLQLEIL